MTTVDLNDTTGLVGEKVGALTDFYEEPGGAWTPGWYKAVVIEGYKTPKSGHQFATEASVAAKGDSNNLRLCLKIFKGEQERTIQEVFNYRQMDFSAERQAFIKEERAANKDSRNWPDKDAQRSSLALVSLSQITVGLGLDKTGGLTILPNGNIATAELIGKACDVRLNTDEKGYNRVTAFAPAGTKTK